jgi:hypothetical protein
MKHSRSHSKKVKKVNKKTKGYKTKGFKKDKAGEVTTLVAVLLTQFWRMCSDQLDESFRKHTEKVLLHLFTIIEDDIRRNNISEHNIYRYLDKLIYEDNITDSRYNKRHNVAVEMWQKAKIAKKESLERAIKISERNLKEAKKKLEKEQRGENIKYARRSLSDKQEFEQLEDDVRLAERYYEEALEEWHNYIPEEEPEYLLDINTWDYIVRHHIEIKKAVDAVINSNERYGHDTLYAQVLTKFADIVERMYHEGEDVVRESIRTRGFGIHSKKHLKKGTVKKRTKKRVH